MTKWPPGLRRIWSHQGLALMMEKTTSSRGLQARPHSDSCYKGRAQDALASEVCCAVEQMCCAWHRACR